jgi:hypothetical protein
MNPGLLGAGPLPSPRGTSVRYPTYFVRFPSLSGPSPVSQGWWLKLLRDSGLRYVYHASCNFRSGGVWMQSASRH